MFDLKVLDEVSTLFGLPETTNNLSSWQYVLHSVVRGTHATFGIFFHKWAIAQSPRRYSELAYYQSWKTLRRKFQQKLSDYERRIIGLTDWKWRAMLVCTCIDCSLH